MINNAMHIIIAICCAMSSYMIGMHIHYDYREFKKINLNKLTLRMSLVNSALSRMALMSSTAKPTHVDIIIVP